MDFNNNGGMNFENPRFGWVKGTIVDMMPTRQGGRRADGCVLFVTLETEAGETVNIILSPVTYVVDFETLSVGMNCTFWYLADAPMILIYPPQYNAVVAARNRNDRMIDVSRYGRELVNQERTLQLKLDGSVDIRTTNNQYFQGNPADHDLVVIYETSTRSIPAQTTPREIVVLCSYSQ